MARVNVGVDPKFLADQHLVAESVEITMITGQLLKHGFKIVSEIPKSFSLGKGHMNFFKNKLVYLQRRLDAVNSEMRRRGFTPGTDITNVLEQAPDNLKKDWQPDCVSSKLVRSRINERLHTRVNNKPGQDFYRYSKKPIPNITKFSKNLVLHNLYEV